MGKNKYQMVINLAGIVTIALGFSVMMGWMLDKEILKSVLPGLPTMKFNTAVCFVLAGATLISTQQKTLSAFHVSKVLAGVLFFIALITISENFLPPGRGIDSLFYYNDSLSAPGSARMAEVTSLCFILLSVSFFIMKSRNSAVQIFSQYLLHCVTLASFIGLIGYLYGVPAFYKIFLPSPVALPTHLLFLLISVSASLINWKKGITGLFTGPEIGNSMARKLFPSIVLLVFILGFLRIFLFKRHVVTVEFGIAVATTNFILISLLFIAITAQRLNRINRRRIKAEESLKFLDLAPDVIVVINNKGEIVFANAQTEKTFGYLKHEVMGHGIEMLIPDRFADLHAAHREKYLSNPLLRPMGTGKELFGKSREGKDIPVEIGLSPIQTNEGVMISAAIRDISERKKADQQIKESEEKFNKAFHSSPVGITLTNMDTGKWVDANDSFLKMTGYKKEEIIGHTSAETGVIDADTRAAVFEELNSSGFIKNRETLIRKKSGETGTVLCSIEKLIVNNAPYSIAILYDITERKKTEQQLIKAQQRLQSFMMNTPTMNWIIDEKNCFRFLNDSYMKAFHLTPSDIGKSLYEIFPGPVCDAFIENNWRVWNSGSALETIEEGIGPDGKKQIYHIFKFPLDPEEGIKLLGGVALDITSDIVNQKELKLSTERYDYVSKATSDAIWDWDIDADTIYRGEGFRSLFGYTEMSSTTQFKLDQIHPDEREGIHAELKKALEGANERWQDEYHFRCADGNYKTILDKAFIIRNEKGRPIRMIGAMRDITEQRMLQHQLVQEEERKKKEVLEAIIHAQERERHEISHELHDNVSQILTTCKLMLEAALQQDNKKYLQETQENLQIAIDEMRNISHRLNPATLKFIGLEGSVNDLLSKINLVGNIRIAFLFLLPDVEKIDNDIQLAIFRIIQEQLNNIIRHSDAKKVSIELSEENNKLKLTIADDGKGYDLQAKKNGLGLRNIFNRAEFHKGTAQIFTEPGKGFKLQVQIPV